MSPLSTPRFRGYSDRVNHAFAYAAKYRPPPSSRLSGYDGAVRTANVAVILAAYHAEEPTLVAAILKQLVEMPDITHRSTRLGDIAAKFGADARDVLEGVLEPPVALLGRPRSWKAQKLDYLATLSLASPRSIDVAAAEAIHHTGCLLADGRRLGVEYVRTIADVGPSEALWWFEALAETIGVHPLWSRRDMIHELRDLLRSFRIAMR